MMNWETGVSIGSMQSLMMPSHAHVYSCFIYWFQFVSRFDLSYILMITRLWYLLIRKLYLISSVSHIPVPASQPEPLLADAKPSQCEAGVPDGGHDGEDGPIRRRIRRPGQWYQTVSFVNQPNGWMWCWSINLLKIIAINIFMMPCSIFIIVA